MKALRPRRPSSTSSTLHPSNGMPTLVGGGRAAASPTKGAPSLPAASQPTPAAGLPAAAPGCLPCCPATRLLLPLSRPGEGGFAAGGGFRGRSTSVPCATLASHARNGPCSGSHVGGQLPTVSERGHSDVGTV
jgi:hypothetical protein